MKVKCIKQLESSYLTEGKEYEVEDETKNSQGLLVGYKLKKNDGGWACYYDSRHFEVVEEKKGKQIGWILRKEMDKPQIKESIKTMLGLSPLSGERMFELETYGNFSKGYIWEDELRKLGVLDIFFEPYYEKSKPDVIGMIVENNYIEMHKTGLIEAKSGAVRISQLEELLSQLDKVSPLTINGHPVGIRKLLIGCSKDGVYISPSGIDEIIKKYNEIFK